MGPNLCISGERVTGIHDVNTQTQKKKCVFNHRTSKTSTGNLVLVSMCYFRCRIIVTALAASVTICVQ